MLEKYLLGDFGTCPRVRCQRQYVLPVGVSEELNTSRVKVYCPKCQEVYQPRSGQVDLDGAYFGTSFPMAFIQNHKQRMMPKDDMEKGPVSYIPKLYGFKVFGSRGSKYQYKFDNEGNAINKKEVDKVLDIKRTEVYESKEEKKVQSDDVCKTESQGENLPPGFKNVAQPTAQESSTGGIPISGGISR